MVNAHLDFLDHRFGQDVDLVLLEGRLRVRDELLAEHWKHSREGLDESNAQAAGQFGVPVLQVVDEEIVKLAAAMRM